MDLAQSAGNSRLAAWSASYFHHIHMSLCLIHSATHLVQLLIADSVEGTFVRCCVPLPPFVYHRFLAFCEDVPSQSMRD